MDKHKEIIALAEKNGRLSLANEILIWLEKNQHSNSDKFKKKFIEYIKQLNNCHY